MKNYFILKCLNFFQVIIGTSAILSDGGLSAISGIQLFIYLFTFFFSGVYIFLIKLSILSSSKILFSWFSRNVRYKVWGKYFKNLKKILPFDVQFFYFFLGQKSSKRMNLISTIFHISPTMVSKFVSLWKK